MAPFDLDDDEYESTRKLHELDKPIAKKDRCYCANSKTKKCDKCRRNLENYRYISNQDYQFMYFDYEDCEENRY